VKASKVGIREAKANLSRLVKEVQKGKEIIITDRGQEVAILTGISRERLSLEARIGQLVTNGWLDPENRNMRPLPPPLPVEGDVAQRFLEEGRSDG